MLFKDDCCRCGLNPGFGTMHQNGLSSLFDFSFDPETTSYSVSVSLMSFLLNRCHAAATISESLSLGTDQFLRNPV